MKKFFLLFILLPLLTVSFNAYSQCTSCTFTAPSGGTSFNLNGNQTLCITANTGDLSININGTGNKICVATGVTWTQTSGLNLGGTTIDVYGTANLNGSFTTNSAAFINVKPGAIANTNSTGFGNNLTINNEGTFNYTSTSGISHQGSFVFNNIGVSSILNATANTLFVIGNGTTFTNEGTMNFKNLENSDALLFENRVGGIVKIGGTFFNHGKIYNAGSVETVCGLFGSVACDFIVGDKGPDVFVTAPGGCLKIGGNATFNGPITLNSGLEVGKDLTINKPISGTNGSIKVLNGVSTITSGGNFTGTNLKFYDVNTAGNGFDANNGNIASNFTVSSTAGCSVACTTPVVSITGTNNLTCSATSVTRTASGGGTYLWSNGLGTNATATMTTAGTYTVTVTATGGCTATATTVVTANTTPPTAGISGNTNLSCANTSITRTATGIGSYLWSNGLGTNATVNISAAGIYTVTVTSANGCTATATTSVVTDNALTWSGTYGNYSGYCSSNYLGTLDNTFVSNITVPSTTSSVKFTFRFGTHNYSSNSSYVRIETGTGTVLATYFPATGDIVDTNGGCLQSRELTATNPSGNTSLKIVVYGDDNWAKLEPTCFSICNLTATVNVTQPVCGQTTGSIAVTAPSGASTFQYKNGSAGTWQSGTTFSSLTAGNYSVYIRDANNTSCEKLLGTYTVNTPPITPTASITGTTNLTCATTSVSRTATGGGSYSWSSGLGTNAIATINTAGTYTVTVTSTGGCTATATTSVTASTIALSSTVSACINQPLQDVATVDVLVSWTNAPAGNKIKVTINNKTEYIDVTALASPQTIRFIVPANGASSQSISASWDVLNCVAATSTFNAPSACSTDNLACEKILYLCGPDKPADGDAWDHGFINYLTAVGAGSVGAAYTLPDASGDGLYDPMNTATKLTVNLNDYTMIIISPTTEANMAPNLLTALKTYSGGILMMNYAEADNLGITNGNAYFSYQNNAYTDNTNQIGIYNYDNINPNYTMVLTGADYFTTADASLWLQANKVSTSTQGLNFNYTASDVLSGISSHGARVYLGYHMNGLYDNIQNGGAMPAPASSYFTPTKHLTLEAKSYLDQAIKNAATGVQVFATGDTKCVGSTINLGASGVGISAYSWSGPSSFISTLQNPTRTNATASMAGVYTVTVTSTTGCTASVTTNVVVNTASAAITGNANLTCTTTSVERTATGGGTYSWSNGLGTTASVNITSAGTYTVTVTNANGCTATATTSVTIDNTVPTATITGNTNLTCTTTSVSRTANGGGSYLWSNALGTSASVNITSAGTYTVTVTNANGCTATATTSVTIDNTVPTATITGNTNLTCTTTSVSRTATGGGTYSWSNGLGTNAVVNITSAGTYTVTVTNANGCTATATTVVTVDNTVPTTSITGSTNLTCTTTSVERTASGGGSYLWSNNLGTTASVNITNAGTYTVTVTNANGCTATATTVVTVDNTVPTTSITGSTNLTCTTTSVERTASGGGSYLWSNNLGTTASVNITNAGTYTVTVTNANGCTATATTVVTVDNTVPTASITGSTNLTCTTTSVERTASGGGSYLWSDNLGTTSSVNIASAGTYTVTVTNANGCTATATTSVTIDNSVPVASITGTTNLTCTTTSVVRTASGGGSYLWSNNLGTTASVNITNAGTYTVTVTNANGCTATATTVVTVDNTEPTASITGTTNLTCTTTSVVRTASGGGSYLWSDNLGTTASVNITNAGTYTVTVTNANGCTATATTSVTIDNSVPVASITGTTNLTCTTTSVVRTASGGGSYLWSNNLGTTASVNITNAGTYTVTVTNANGCTATATTSVTIDNTVPTASITGSTNLTCTTTSVERTASGGGSYLWSNNLGTTASVNIASAGTYTVTVTNANGCTATATTSVTIDNSVPVASITGNTNLTCATTSVSRTASGGGSYLWSNNLGTTASVNITSAGTYTVTVTNANGCTATATTVVTSDSTVPQPTTASAEKCGEGTLTLTASGCDGTYNWYSSSSSNTSLATTASFTTSVISTTTLYYVSCTVGSCTSSRSVATATINEIPTNITASSSSPIKEGNSLNLASTSTGGTNYSWTGPNNFTSTVQNPTISTATELIEGVYTVTVSSPKGCTATATTNVIVFNLSNLPECTEQVTVTASNNSPIISGNAINLSVIATGAIDYAWAGPNGFTSSSQNPSIANSTLLMAGVYTVAVTVDGICKATATTNVIINCLTNPLASSNTPICVGNTLNLSASGGNSYAWSGPNNFTSTQQNPTISNAQITAQGVYTVTLTGVNCTTTVTTNVVINSLPNAEAGIDKTITCTTASVQIGSDAVIPNATYLWSPSTGLSVTNASIVTATPSTTATYTLTVTNNLTGCTATDAVVVTVDKAVPNAEAGIDKTITCTTALVQIGSDAVIPNATYLWSPSTGLSATNASIVTATPSTTTTYTLTVTNNLTGCTATDAVVVTVDKAVPNAEAGIDKTITCTTTSVQIGSDAVIPNATYLWSPSAGLSATNASIVTATPSTTTTYTLTVTNNLTGCTVTDAVVVTVDKSVPNAEAGIDKTITCTTTSVQIGSDAVIPNATYLWSPSAGLSATNASIVTATPSTMTTYTLTVTNNLTGCTATDAVVVTVDKTTPTASITGTNNLTCTASSVTRVASGGGSYLWSNNLGTSATATISTAGTYTVTVTSANGCTATATTSVIVDAGVPTVAITATEDTLTCTKTQSILTTDIAPAGTYTYLWSNGSTSSSINVNDAGTYSVEVTAANGCKASASVLIVEFNTVTAQIDVKAVDCKGGNNGSITVTGFDGIAPYKFKLNTGTFQSNNVFSGLTTGTYAVAIQDAGGCTASINVTVSEPSTSVALTVTPTNLKCNGATDGQIEATATGGTPAYSFAINGGAAQPNNVFTNLVAGTYTITATDTKGCSVTATTEITQPTKLAIAALGSTIDCSTPKGTITATVTGGTPAYQYSIDGTNFQPSNSFANLNGGTYTITVKDLNLCVGTITAAITVADTVKPTFTSAVAIMATCTAGDANNDGKLTLTGVLNGVNYQYSAGSTFNASTAVPAVATAISSNGVLTSTLPNPTANSQFYTIRIFNSNGCYKDVTVELLKRVCDCKPSICVPVLIKKTKSK